MINYFDEALKEFTALSEATQEQWTSQKSDEGKQVDYGNFCE